MEETNKAHYNHPEEIPYGLRGRWFNFLNSFLSSTQSWVEISKIEDDVMYGTGYIPSRDNVFIFKATFSQKGGLFHLYKVEFIRNALDGRVIKKTLYDALQPGVQKGVEKIITPEDPDEFFRSGVIKGTIENKVVLNEVFESREEIWAYTSCPINEPQTLREYERNWNFLAKFEKFLERAALKRLFKEFKGGRNEMIFAQSFEQ